MRTMDMVKIIALAIFTYFVYNKGRDLYMAYYESKFKVNLKKYQKVKGAANVSEEKYQEVRQDYLKALADYHAYLDQHKNKS